MIVASHKIELKPTKSQVEFFTKACGVARFAYNWGLAEWQRMYKDGVKPNWTKVTKTLRNIQDRDFPWMREVSKWICEVSLQNLGTAFEKFFVWIKNGRKGKKFGYPQFKKKGRCRDSFVADVANNTDPNHHQYSVQVDRKRIRIPKLGFVRMTQEVRFSGRITRAIVSRTADKWFVSLQVHTDDIKPVEAKTKQLACGVDLGVKTLATIFDGRDFQEVEGPKPHRRLLGRMRRLQRSLFRKKLGSRNRHKVNIRVARLHMRIVNIRKDALHKITNRLTRNYQVVGIEDLNVSGMLKNHKLARVISDCGFGEFRRQVEYKCDWYDSEPVIVDRFFPSSRLCPVCRVVNKDLTLSDREWVCSGCNTVHHRDRTASQNLYEYAVGYTATACGASGSGSESKDSDLTVCCEAGTVTFKE